MQILHSKWMPQAGKELLQNGAFYWVETTERRRFCNASQRPRQLVATNLARLLMRELRIQPPNFRKLEDLISPQVALLSDCLQSDEVCREQIWGEQVRSLHLKDWMASLEQLAEL